MSPHFYSALAAIGCHLPACKDIQLAIIPSLSPPQLITALFLSLPPFFFFTSLVIFSFSLPIGKSFFFFLLSIIWQSQSSLLLFLYLLCLLCPNYKVVHFSLSYFPPHD